MQLHFHRVLEQQQALEAASERTQSVETFSPNACQSRQTTPGGDSVVSFKTHLNLTQKLIPTINTRDTES